MTELLYRLEVGNKCIILDDANKRISLDSSLYTPMTLEKAKEVANEIGLEVIKAYEIRKHYEETEKVISTNILRLIE